MKEKKTMYQAVKDEIFEGFVKNGCDFSAYNVTLNIRNKVNNGLLEIDQLPYEMINGVMTQEIFHTDVKGAMVFVIEDFGLPGYKRAWISKENDVPAHFAYVVDSGSNVDPTTSKNHQIYVSNKMNIPVTAVTPSQKVVSTSAPQLPLAPLPAPVVHYHQNLPSLATPVTQVGGYRNPAGDPNDPMIVKMLTSYFEKRISEGQPATLHQAQSRMRRHRLTIAQIADIATKNGYDLVKGSCYHRSEIVKSRAAFIANLI